MIAFNFLHDAPPGAIERLRNIRIARDLRTPVAALLTACAVVCVWWALERCWIAQARREEAVATARLERSRAAFAQTRLMRSNVDELLALDARLRSIRLSGSVLSARLADIGNHVPGRAWLTSIARANDGLQLEGRAEGFNALSETVADLMSVTVRSSPTLVHAAKEDPSRGGLVSFTIRLAERQQ